MHNVWLIARREYVERVRTRSFVITTIMIPVVMAACLLGSVFLGSREDMDRHIVIVSSDLALAERVQEELQKVPSQQAAEASRPQGFSLHPKPPRFTADVMEPAQGTRALLDRDLDDNEIDGYLWISPAVDGEQPAFSYTPRSSSDKATQSAVTAAVSRILLRDQLKHQGVAAGEANTLTEPVEVHSLGESHHRDRASSMISIGILFFLMYLVIMLYGMNVARSIIEEKTSRIFEVLLSVVRPEEMMAGKIIGVGTVGLTQVGIWLAFILVGAGGAAGLTPGGETFHPSLSGAQLAYFFVFFLLGYLFYSSIAAALGAMTNSEQELQQMNIFLMLPLLLCFLLLGTVMFTPDALLARVLALFPPFTPLLMYMRLSLGHPRPWEVALSLALLIGSIAGLIWLTSRIYRVGVLMYGKRPTIGELMRWLKYS